MNITMKGKYQTRDGMPVRILCVDGPSGEPVIGIIDNWDEPCQWTLDGHFWVSGVGSECDRDLVPAPAGFVIISNKSGLPLADNRRGIWMDRSDAVAFCNEASEHVVGIAWVDD